MNNHNCESCRGVYSRRQVLQSGVGFGAVALASLLARDRRLLAAGEPAFVRRAHFRPRAKQIIFLFMSGGPSQVDTFDPKPVLTRLAGENVPESIAKLVPRLSRGSGRRNLLASPFAFKEYGQSGIPVSEILPKALLFRFRANLQATLTLVFLERVTELLKVLFPTRDRSRYSAYPLAIYELAKMTKAIIATTHCRDLPLRINEHKRKLPHKMAAERETSRIVIKNSASRRSPTSYNLRTSAIELMRNAATEVTTTIARLTPARTPYGAPFGDQNATRAQNSRTPERRAPFAHPHQNPARKTQQTISRRGAESQREVPCLSPRPLRLCAKARCV